MFIQLLADDAPLYFSLLLGIILSIIFHELAHGYVSIMLGDNTPIRLQRMTFNPMVNLGPTSLIFLALVGMGWGSMPYDPNFRGGRYHRLWVALAGPAANLAIALLLLIILVAVVYTQRHAPDANFPYANVIQYSKLLAGLNLALAFFNLIPVPPLDGCTALMTIDRRYASFVDNSPQFQQFGFIGIFVFFSLLSWNGYNIWGISIGIVVKTAIAILRLLPA